jgi:hypothetical protein
MTQANTLRNSSLENLASTNQTNIFTKALYFVAKNGFEGLRVSVVKISDMFFNNAFDLLASYDVIFRLLMILSVVAILILTIFLVPIVFSVHKTNNKVLSLFGNIHFPEIKGLIVKCENYLENFLNEEKDPRDYAYKIENAAGKASFI